MELSLLHAGSFDRSRETWVHEKTVPFAILGQALRGEYEVSMAGREVRVSGEEAFLAPPHTPLRFIHHVEDGRFTAQWVHFSFTLYGGLDVATLLEMPPVVRFPGLTELIQELLALAESRDLSALARQRELGWCLLRQVCEVSGPRPDLAERLRAGQRLQPLLEHLEAHLIAPLTVRDMATVAGMSVSRFHAFFKARQGCGPMEYLTRLRLRRAATLLATPGRLLVKEVAAATGFANAGHLSREFTRRYGMNPRTWRERGG
jgi:AraC-like DNA-binding protein